MGKRSKNERRLESILPKRETEHQEGKYHLVYQIKKSHIFQFLVLNEDARFVVQTKTNIEVNITVLIATELSV